jgi:methyl-accepting chemotaxis protein
MQDFMAKSEEELSEYYIESLQEYYDTVSALAAKYGEGSEEYLKGVEEAQKTLETKTGYALGEIEDLTIKAGDLNQKFAAGCVDTFTNTILGGIYTNYTTYEELYEGINSALAVSTNGLKDAYTNLQTEIGRVCEAAGIDVSKFSELVSGKVDDLSTKTGELVEEVKGIATAYENAFKDTVKHANDYYDKTGGYKDTLTKYIKLAEKMKSTYEAAIAIKEKADKDEADEKSRLEYAGTFV